MSYKIGERKNNEIEIKFNIEKDVWEKALDKAYEQSKDKFKLEGFRKGKVPKSLIIKTYGKGVFFEDAFDIVLQETYFECIEKENLEPVAQPEISLDSISEDGAAYTAKVTLKPIVNIPDKMPKVEKPEVAEVTEEDINLELRHYQDKASAWIDITDRAAQMGDTVEIDYSGSVDGVKFDGGTAEHQPLELGSHQFIPGFEEQVVGMKIGEEKDINVKFPEDYGHEPLKGKDSVFAIKLHAIKQKDVPAIDDDLAKDVSEFDTIAELKEDIKKNIQKKNEETANRQLEERIIEAYIEAAKIDVPNAMIERATDDLLKEFEQNLSYQGAKLEDYYKITNSTEADLRKQYVESAKKRVLGSLVIDALLVKYADQLKVEKSEIDAKIEEIYKQYNISGDQYKDMFKGMETYIEREIKTIKLFDLLKGQIK